MHFHISILLFFLLQLQFVLCQGGPSTRKWYRAAPTPPITSFHPQDAAVCFISSKTLLLSFFQSFNASGYRTPIRINEHRQCNSSLVQLHLLFRCVSFQDSFHCLLFDLAYLFYIYSKSFDML